jgi:hypothetical protein
MENDVEVKLLPDEYAWLYDSCGLPFDSDPLHQFTKANRSRLAFFIAGFYVFVGDSADSCGLREPVQ